MRHENDISMSAHNENDIKNDDLSNINRYNCVIINLH